MSTQGDLFSFVGTYSRFWLPAVLDHFVTFPPVLCNGDGCSIFLKLHGMEDRISLIATTRRELHPRILHESTSYSIARPRLREAARIWRTEGRITESAGLTGWVGAFNRSINVDLREPEQLERYEDPDRDVPAPVWSDKSRGFFDWEGPRPFLAAPMRLDGDGEPLGVVRVTTLRADAQQFTDEHEQRLVEFGQHLASFFQANTDRPGEVEHLFRMWAARDGDLLAGRITEAVPPLFGMDCCSFFQRDEESRFVLRSTAASSTLDSQDAANFREFRKAQGNLYYLEGRTKTGTCIKRQQPLLLRRSEEGDWELNGKKAEFEAESRDRTFIHPDAAPEAHCEIRPGRSGTLLIIPVRDTVNPRMLAGVLRAVSTNPDLTGEQAIFELMQFAGDLGRCLGETTRDEIQKRSVESLLRELDRVDSDAPKWLAVAQILAKAIDADAVTIYIREGNRLVSRPEATYLNEEQLLREESQDSLENHRRHHNRFRDNIGRTSYAQGEGRTGWPFANRKILSLKRFYDEMELQRLKVSPERAQCEIAKAGPFIAAPFMLRPEGRVDGVVRAVRREDNRLGTFSLAHEVILRSCAPTLAALLRWSRQPPGAIVSYDTKEEHLVRDLDRFLAAIGFKARYLHRGEVEEGEPLQRFENLMEECLAGIVIATPEEAHGSRISENVIVEATRLSKELSERTLVLRERNVLLPVMLGRLKAFDFDMENGLHSVKTQIAETLREWLSKR